MGDLDRRLNELFEQLKSEVREQFRDDVYSRHLKDRGQSGEENKRGWGLYATPDCHKENFCHVEARVRENKRLPDCPLPHLLVAVKKGRADRAGASYGSEAEARWCVPEGDESKLKEVAKYLVKIYRQWKQRGSLKGPRPFKNHSSPSPLKERGRKGVR